MAVESIHYLIACAFVLMWVLIGHLTVRCRPTAEHNEPVHRRVDGVANGVGGPAALADRRANLTSKPVLNVGQTRRGY